MVEKHLIETMTLENVVDRLETADQYNCDKLMTAAKCKILENKYEVLSSRVSEIKRIIKPIHSNTEMGRF
jgi:hypothetical protein